MLSWISPPIARWVPLYNFRVFFLPDLSAALGILVIGVPEAIAFASIAGLPPESGLYSTLVAPLIYGILGASPALSLGPTSLISILTAACLPDTWGGKPLEPESQPLAAVASALAVCVGCLQLLLYAISGHTLTRFISTPLLSGFVTGLALLVASTQFASLLGIPRCSSPSGASCTFVESVISVFTNAPTIQWASPVAALASLALLLSWKLILPRYLPASLLPVKFLGPLVLLILSVALVARFSPPAVVAFGIKLVEPIPPGLPTPSSSSLPSPSETSSADAFQLLSSALPVAIISYIELASVGISATRARANAAAAAASGSSSSSSRPLPPPPPTEPPPLAAANAFTGLFQGYPVTASVSRTAVALDMEAATPAASLFTALAIIPVLLLATPALSLLPRVVTAAMVLAVIYRLVEVPYAVRLWRRGERRDASVFFVALACTLVLEVSQGFMVALGVSWVVALTRQEGKAGVVLYDARDCTTPLKGIQAGGGGVPPRVPSWWRSTPSTTPLPLPLPLALVLVLVLVLAPLL